MQSSWIDAWTGSDSLGWFEMVGRNVQGMLAWMVVHDISFSLNRGSYYLHCCFGFGWP